jgi:hypothetical protein
MTVDDPMICGYVLIQKVSHGMLYIISKVKLSPYRPWKILGLPEVEALRFSDIRLIDGGEIVSPTRRPLFTPRKIPSTHFC